MDNNTTNRFDIKISYEKIFFEYDNMTYFILNDLYINSPYGFEYDLWITHGDISNPVDDINLYNKVINHYLRGKKITKIKYRLIND